MVAKHTDEYENAYVNVTTTQGCPPAVAETRYDTIPKIVKIVHINIDNGNIIADIDAGSIEVYDSRNAHIGYPYSTPKIGEFHSNGYTIIAKDVPRNVPLIIVIRDENGVIISTEKILISE